MLVAAFLLSLGPRLSLAGWSPYVLLMDWYPGMAQARNVYRFAVFVLPSPASCRTSINLSRSALPT